MKYIWENLPKKTTMFTVRNATLRNLNTGEIVQHYSSNTRIDIVQKCVTEKNTYYRTQSAEHHNLNWAFEASAFGLPNEKAPSAPVNSLKVKPNSVPLHTTPGTKKQKSTKKSSTPQDGGAMEIISWLKKIFRIK